MIIFEDLWSLLYDHGASARKEEGTRRYWATLTPEQQDNDLCEIVTITGPFPNSTT